MQESFGLVINTLSISFLQYSLAADYPSCLASPVVTRRIIILTPARSAVFVINSLTESLNPPATR